MHFFRVICVLILISASLQAPTNNRSKNYLAKKQSLIHQSKTKTTRTDVAITPFKSPLSDGMFIKIFN